jgi:phosphoglycerate dehydrogenase-like enzyme
LVALRLYFLNVFIAMSSSHRPPALYALDPGSLDVIYGPEEQKRIRELVDIYAPVQSRASLQKDSSVLEKAEILFSGWGAPIMDAPFLAAAPNLKAVFYGAGSIRYFTPPEFWARRILITHAAEANAIPVAEYCLAVILLSLKNFWGLAAGTRRGMGWIHNGAHLREVPGAFRSTVGFISLGAIARKTIAYLQSHDLQLLVHSRSLTSESAARLNVATASLDQIFSECDVVSLHTPDLPSTKGMIRGRHFDLMKRGATFINTARGAVVHEAEMIAVLQRRPDITVVLDVTDPEPPLTHSPLLFLPNVVLTPHLAGSAGRECQRLGHFMVQELERYLAGQPLRYQVTAEVAQTMA